MLVPKFKSRKRTCIAEKKRKGARFRLIKKELLLSFFQQMVETQHFIKQYPPQHFGSKS
jgi:hypothetical protein